MIDLNCFIPFTSLLLNNIFPVASLQTTKKLYELMKLSFVNENAS